MTNATRKAENETGENKSGKVVEKIPQKSRKKGKTPKEVMTAHIEDEDHVITEEEFRNLATGADLEVEADTAHEPLDIKDDNDRPKDEDKDHKIITSWDVID